MNDDVVPVKNELVIEFNTKLLESVMNELVAPVKKELVCEFVTKDDVGPVKNDDVSLFVTKELVLIVVLFKANAAVTEYDADKTVIEAV
jgi:hypothetical protein